MTTANPIISFVILSRMIDIDNILVSYGLKNEDLELFKAELKPNFIKKGRPFILAGQISRYIAIIEEGYLRTYHLNEDTNEVTTEFNQPGMFCSSFYSFYTGQPSLEYIKAITDTKILLLSHTSLQKLYSLSFGINVFGRRVLEKACIERDLRLIKVMHLSAKEKYKWFLEKYPEVYKVSQLSHIASFLGIKPETLSRTRRKITS
jgi:CRP/FNR family transcriptional regulator, anaerobic regulatory protein